LRLLLITVSPHRIHQEFREWFDSAHHIQIQGRTIETLLREIDGETTASFIAMPPHQDEYIQDSFYGRFFDTTVRMSLRLMTSRDGRVVMAPPRAMKGDIVCVLFACSVPALLRKHTDKDMYTVVEECYLDGCMEGEAFQGDKYAEEVFVIM
jgi:hypothetical protein